MQRVAITKWFIVFSSIVFFIGCSMHFRNGQELEEQERWEEAAIEYRLAYVDDPDDGEIQEALTRTNKKVAQENFERYQQYLASKEYRKAYSRLEAIGVQDPSLEEATLEQNHWMRILIAGKIEFQLDRLLTNIRLADQMQLQIMINSPTGKILTADISNETGIFFVEDVLYKKQLRDLPQYSIHMIGVKLTKKSTDQRTSHEFKRFINFQGLIPRPTTGTLKTITNPSTKTVLSHRPELVDSQMAEFDLWFPPRIIYYDLALNDTEIQINTEDRSDFMPFAFYLNSEQRRAFVDFGVSQLILNNKTRDWGIQKKLYRTKSDDYFYQFSRNLALYPYFFYKDGVYRYIVKK